MSVCFAVANAPDDPEFPPNVKEVRHSTIAVAGNSVGCANL